MFTFYFALGKISKGNGGGGDFIDMRGFYRLVSIWENVKAGQRVHFSDISSKCGPCWSARDSSRWRPSPASLDLLTRKAQRPKGPVSEDGLRARADPSVSKTPRGLGQFWPLPTLWRSPRQSGWSTSSSQCDPSVAPLVPEGPTLSPLQCGL